MIPAMVLWLAASDPAPVAVDDIPSPPSLELLEFLGRYEDADGKWLDPIELERQLSRPDDKQPDEPKKTDADVADTADTPHPADSR
ncbi:MAG: hypothetical protein R3200_01580 [Xanthomonadales bacterium]|nr:hypothetical protein [Xanthomonadales bacterium]